MLQTHFYNGIPGRSFSGSCFGSSRNSTANGTTDRLFTGARFENSIGIYQVGGRFYDPAIGRFLQPDPMGQLKLNDSSPFLPLTVSYSDSGLAVGLGQWNRGQRNTAAPLDPQLLNRYSYSRNNPETYYDPSGHFVWIAAGAVIGGAVGFGAYYFTHQDSFNLGEAAVWTGGGALAGSGVGLAGELIAGGALAGGISLGSVSAAGASGAAGAAGAAQQLSRLGLNSGQAANLIRTIASESTRGIQNGITVLGHYGESGGYIQKAREVGGTYLEIADDAWAALGSQSLRWAVNQQFLDNAIARGDKFLLTTAVPRVGSFFQQEVQYLLDKGYQYVIINGATYLQKVE